MNKEKPTKKDEDKIEHITLNIQFSNGDRIESFIQRNDSIKKLIKENPMIQRVIDGELV